jgi:Skp family chaperone for outer membrane proteins
MRLRHALPALATMALMVVSSASAAQAQAAAPAAPTFGGPAIQGVCFLSREAVFTNAKVGKVATTRLQQLTQQAQSQIQAEGAPITADLTAYRAQAASLKPEERQTREQALNQRVQKVQADEALLGREIEATRIKAMERIAQEIQPVVATAYTAKGCGLLLNREAVLGGNMANDLTAAVVQGLDAKITTISFDRETLPAQAPAPAAKP